MQTKYPVLKSISLALKIFAWIGFLGIIIILGLPQYYIPSKSPFGIVIPVVGGALWFMFCYALAELIRVLVDIESNTSNISKSDD